MIEERSRWKNKEKARKSSIIFTLVKKQKGKRRQKYAKVSWVASAG